MRKYNILSLIPLLMFLFCSLAYSQTGSTTSENVTITTYYPAPYSEYRILRLVPTTQPACGAGNKGAIYYDSAPAKNKPYVCDGTNWAPIGAGVAECKTFYQNCAGAQANKTFNCDGHRTSCPTSHPLMVGGGCYFQGEVSAGRRASWRTDNSTYPSYVVDSANLTISGTGTENTWQCHDRTDHADLLYTFVRCCK